jgi:hypothetical protein
MSTNADEIARLRASIAADEGKIEALKERLADADRRSAAAAEKLARRQRADRAAMEWALRHVGCDPDCVPEALAMIELDSFDGMSIEARDRAAERVAREVMRQHRHLTATGQREGWHPPYGPHVPRRFRARPEPDRERVEDELIRTGRYIGF